jgi:beta-lactamase regulating signal transducer with metallopeptidase domain
MSGIAPTADTQLLQELGWSLLHFVWQGGMIALALSLFLRIARRHPAQFRYVASCVAFGLMFLCPAGTVFYLAVGPDAVVHPASAHIIPLSLRDTASFPSSSLLANFTTTANQEMSWIVAFWSAGVLVFFTHLLLGSIAADRLKKKSMIPVPDALRSAAARVAQRLKISQNFQLCASSAVAGPAVIGWLRPVILVPLASVSGLLPEQIEAILAHELAHIRRHDYLVNTLQTVAEGLLFYHPAVWWVSKQIRREREHCCDDVAVMVSGSPLTYAKALSLLEEQRGSTRPQLALGANGGQLAMRIKRLLTQTERTVGSCGTTLSLLSVGLVTVGTIFLLSNVAAGKVAAQSVQPLSHFGLPTPNSTPAQRPDMTCTYYDPKGYGFSGTCGVHTGNEATYYCATDRDKKLTQDQIACEWKVQRLREWELRQRRGK